MQSENTCALLYHPAAAPGHTPAEANGLLRPGALLFVRIIQGVSFDCVVLDFDGTFTDVTKEAASFVRVHQQFLAELVPRVTRT